MFDKLLKTEDVRSEWLADPVRAVQWRKTLAEFDRCFGSRAESPATVPVPATATGTGSESTGQSATTTTDSGAAFNWDDAFSEEPRDAEAFHKAYDGKVKGKFAWSPELTGYLIGNEDDSAIIKLFVEASEDIEIPETEPFLTYGAGTWLQDGKAVAYLDENPEGKAVICEFTSDACKVVLEAHKFF